jgi:hypothetical protein
MGTLASGTVGVTFVLALWAIVAAALILTKVE